MRRLHRRALLTAAAAGVAALTGCQSASETPTGGDATPTDTPTDGPDGPGSPTPGTPGEWSPEPAELEGRAREFLGLLRDGEFEAAHERFAPAAASQISVEQLEGTWGGITDQFGGYLGLSGVEHGESGGYRVVTGTARFERGQLRVVVSFGEEGVVGFRVVPGSGGQWSPAGYVDQSAFTERELTLSTPVDCSLGATLTLPRGDGDVPGVVFVHGSGPNDRDETVGPTKLFKDLAWGLASRGVASLRYDKRTAACDIDLADATIDDIVTDDALTAVERLRGVDRVPDEDVVVVGHSIGATLAPRVAARDGRLAGVVMLAALARPVTDALLQQNRYLVERDGTVTEAEQEQLDEVGRLVERIRTGDIPDGEVLYLGGDEYWQTLRAYDPVATARDLSLPRLVLQGERDYQVTPEGDFARWQEALGGQESVTLRQYDRLNHLFMPGEGQPGPEEYFRPNNAPERVVEDIAAFVTEHT
ncbi:MAG: alpha/beta fold hydrolase [Haloarculaceae archaeon]